jgi:hypothetical protein
MNFNNSNFTDDFDKKDGNVDFDDIPYWQQTILKSFFRESSITRNRSQNKRSLSRRSSYKPRTPSSGPSEKQLSAPYIEEVLPEQPHFMRRLSDQSSSDTKPQSN